MITHDLGVIAGFADRVGVMYAGKLVETGAVDDVFYRPRMPYTLGLLAAVPYPDLGRKLDLTAVLEGAERRPEDWRAPFAWTPESAGELVDVGDGHRVRMQRTEEAVPA
jgi:ABC-type dipeptide/oligopeptide/nickel transport system ATPase component